MVSDVLVKCIASVYYKRKNNVKLMKRLIWYKYMYVLVQLAYREWTRLILYSI